MALRISGSAGSWCLGNGVAVIGRAADCQIRIKDPRLSRRHAQFVIDGGTVLIQELANTNGVLVNGDRIRGKRYVQNGDTVVCGPCVLQVAIDAVGGQPLPPPPLEPQPLIEDDTEPMGVPVLPSTSGARRIDPGIVAAITVQTQLPPPTASQTLVPSSEPAEVLSPLESATGDRPAPEARADSTRRRNHSSTSMLPGDFAPSEHDALLDRSSDLVPARIAAAVLDGLIVGAAAGGAFLIPLIVGYAAALRQAGAVLDHGLPSLSAAGTPASLGQLAATLLGSGGWLRSFQLADALRASAPGPFSTLALGAALGAAAAVLIALSLTVTPTVLHGAPYWHRRFGLRINLATSGHHPAWWRAVLRWVLVLPLLPVVAVTAILGRRGPHDWLAGTQVRRRRD